MISRTVGCLVGLGVGARVGDRVGLSVGLYYSERMINTIEQENKRDKSSIEKQKRR